MLSPVAQASSTITYTYDARGRLKTVSLSGGMHSGAVTTYTYDKANNRVRKQVTGA
ncbi:RHS repeat domain-containing protein [Hyphomonas polymorpha]|nr:RHS repeat domain-containing protein [Hyphomonas polymorpha]